MKILMSAAGSSASISIIKHLQKLGHYVIGIDANKHSQSLALEVCDEFYLSPLCNSPEFIPFINSLKDAFDLYIPFIDEELIALSSTHHLDKELKKRIIINSLETIKICTSKVNFQHYCQQNNLPVAPIAKKPPAIFKPEFGRGSKGIFIIDDTELLPYFNKKQGVIQKLISGVEYTVDTLIDNDGNWQYSVARKRVETVGVSRIGTIDQNPVVLNLAKLCCEKIAFKGPVNIQVMLDENNIAHLIEINPRLSGSLIFTTLAGFDIIDLTLKSWLRQPYDLPQDDNISSKSFIRYWQEHIC